MIAIRRLAPWALAAALASAYLCVGADPAAAAEPSTSARPFTVDDLLRSERFGSVQFTPDGRRILFERLGPYEGADRFDLSFLGAWSTSELWIADRDAPEDARPLLAGGEGRGVVMGGFSPSGRRLMVHRLQHDRWDVGVVELATGEVQWLGPGAEPPVKGETATWRSEDEVILTSRADGDLPYEIGALAAAVRRTSQRRATAARGGVATTVWGAGAFSEPGGWAAPMQTFRIDLRSGVRTLLAEGQTTDLSLSPDARWLALVDRGPPNAVDAEAPFRPTEQPEQRRLEILDLETGARWSPCEGCDIAVGLLSWSAEGRLLVWARDPSRVPTAGRLLMLDPGAQSATAAGLEDLEPDVGAFRDASFQTVRAAWLGDSPIVLARRAGTERNDWYRLGPAGPVNLTATLTAAPGGLEALWDDGFLTLADGAVWSVAADGAARRLDAPAPANPVVTLTHWASPRLRLNTPPGRRWTPVRDDAGTLWRIGPNLPAAVIAENASGVPGALGLDLVVDRLVENGVETLRLLTAGDPPAEVATINPAHGGITFAQPFSVQGAGGSEIPRLGWLHAPPGGLQPRTPVIVVAYPGASGALSGNPAEFNAMSNIQLLAGMGYAVLVPTLPGTGADGPAAQLTERVLAALDAALDQYPDLDGDRVGYLGHSFGGYAGLVLATRTDRFTSFVILSASSDLAASWGAFAGFGRENPEFGITSRRNAGWAEQGQGAMGGPPWAAPEAYRRNSPFYQAGAISSPILLLHGELDFVPITQAEALFTALWRQDKDVQLITYWGEHHLFSSPGTIRDAWGRIDAWFARTLGVSPARLRPAPDAPPNASPRPPPTPLQAAQARRQSSEARPHPAGLP